ncbi:MAG: chemotaxis-specific protein-glutamate methyltransferase CheB [Polyangiaceae bacterium]|jgi:two-component system chemotaxis response regulator CheB
MNTPSVRVLVVDDSAFARKVLREVLSNDPAIDVVGIARDGLDALEKIGELKPDVVVLDLMMPSLDGVGVLQALRGKPGPRFVIVSTSDEASPLAVQALQAGAVDLVHKPTALATDRLYELSSDLVHKVKMAASVRQPIEPATRAPKADLVVAKSTAVGIVVIGASTGGPQALTRLLGELPRDLPVPVAVVLHLPVGYTGPLADRLDKACAIDVIEAHDGAVLRPGLAVIARAGMHLKIAGAPRNARVRLDVAPVDTPHCPAVDVLFATAAETWGPHVLGVVLTGMGEDGLQGSRAIRAKGGSLLTEAESSCVVYGMPRAVAESGLSHRSISLDAMSAAIVRSL